MTVNSAICKTCGTKKSHSFPGGSYKLDIVIPETYPFNPPKVNVEIYINILFNLGS